MILNFFNIYFWCFFYFLGGGRGSFSDLFFLTNYFIFIIIIRVADFTAPIYPLCVGRHSNMRQITSTRVASLLVEGSKPPSRIGRGG